MIRVESLVKKYGGRAVLRSVSFEVPSGQILALVGPSGGGKSTLLRCMHGLEPFDSGRVRVGDAAIEGGSTRKNRAGIAGIRATAGIVFQQWHLFAHMTALENVIEAPVQVRGLSLEDAKRKARDLLERVGMAHRADALPRRLSGGEQQRVAIARALAMEPKVLFMDEPTSALDPQRVSDLVALLRTLTKDGLTLAIVTHDMRFVNDIAQRALVLSGGDIVEDGTPRQILQNPQHKDTRAFLGQS